MTIQPHRCTLFCFILSWALTFVPSWFIGSAIIVIMSNHHLFPCWGCTP